MCRYKELVCKEEEKEDPPSTDTLVDDLSLSDDDDVGVGEGQGVGGEGAGGGGGVEEVPRNPSGGGATTGSAKSSSWEFLGSDLQKSMKRRREDSNEELGVPRHLSERKRLRSIFDQRGGGGMKNKQQMAAMENVKREGSNEERYFVREEKENSLVSDLSLSDSEDEIEEKCIEEDEKTDGNTKKDVENSKKNQTAAWEDDGRWRTTVDKLRNIVKVRLHVCKRYPQDRHIFKGRDGKNK